MNICTQQDKLKMFGNRLQPLLETANVSKDCIKVKLVLTHLLLFVFDARSNLYLAGYLAYVITRQS